MKTISELTPFYNKLDASALLPIVAEVSQGTLGTRKMSFEALKVLFSGYEIAGVLTAGSTTITLPASAPAAYVPSGTAYAVGALVTVSSKYYICIKAIASSTNWDADCENFIEIDLPGASSNIRVYTNPALNYDDISVSNGAVTLTFAEQDNDVAVKVRID
jgi:hypothetical protein